MSPGTVIRRPTDTELSLLPDIEVASYQRYADVGMTEIALANCPDLVALRRAHSAGNVLVALSEGSLTGFVECHEIDGTLYVAGVSVSPMFAGNRIGAALLESAAERARVQGLDRLTLTTFRDVPWNAPYYLRLGWRVVDEDDSGPGLRAIRSRQREAGHERWPRVTMLKHT